MRKWTLIAVASILLLATLMASGCTSYSATQPKRDVPALKKIRVGIGIVPLPHYAHMWVAKQNPDECIKLLLEDMKIPQSQLSKVVNKFNYDGTITDNFVTDMKDTEEFMRKNALLKTQVDVQSLIRRK